MLIEISVKNFKSIKEKQTFSLIAKKKIKEFQASTISLNKNQYLKSAIVYGANGSGKSNLIQVFYALKRMVTSSGNYKNDEGINHYLPFILDGVHLNKPSEIEISFIAKDNFRYNYSIVFTRELIVSEVLTFFPGKNPALLYERKHGEKTVIGPSLKQNISGIEELLYKNQLLLSKVRTEKIDSLIPAYTFFARHLSVYNFHDKEFDNLIVQGVSRMMDTQKKDWLRHNITQLMRVADIGITNMNFRKEKAKQLFKGHSQDEELSQPDDKYTVYATHKMYENGKESGELEFDILLESTGTNKLLAVGLFLLGALADGDVIIIDELDKSLHPFITKLLIQIVNSKLTNPKNAQLVFASHDVSLLDNKMFRRDQVFFAEKNHFGESSYQSLADIQGVRKDFPFDKYYMRGLFGGVPLINEFDLDFKFDNES